MPSQPRMAVSLDLLGLYRALFERSCDAINALAAALHTHYTRRSFHMVNRKVSLLIFLLQSTKLELHRVVLYRILFIAALPRLSSGMTSDVT